MKRYKIRILLATGFTLVELMVVVAIIGILSSIALPQYKKYQWKAKRSEGFLVLGAAYTASQGLFAEYDAFGTCIGPAGYGHPSNAIYGLNVATGDNNATVVANGGPCAAPSTEGVDHFCYSRELPGFTTGGCNGAGYTYASSQGSAVYELTASRYQLLGGPPYKAEILKILNYNTSKDVQIFVSDLNL